MDPTPFHPSSDPQTPRTIAIIVLLLVVVFVALKGVCENEFAGFDDPLTLYQNPRLHPPPPESVLHASLWYWSHPAYSLYIPVTYEVWASLTPLAHLKTPVQGNIDLNAGVFHTADLCAHLLNVAVVFLLLRLLSQRDWAAAFGALFYGLHPLQVEPVAWASGMKDVLCGLGVMLALWQYLLYASADRPDFSARRFPRPRIHYVLSAIFLVLAMLCKPSAMMMPAIAAILDWLIIGRSPRRVLIGVLPLIIVILPLVVVAKLAQSGSATDFVPIWQRPFIASDALAFYLGKVLAPLQLAACYARRPVTVIQHGWLWWTWIVPAAVAGTLFILGKKRAWLLAAGGVMLVALAPVIGFTSFDYQRISTVADHYMYVAMLGPAIAVTFLLATLPAGWPRRAAGSAAAVVLIIFAVLSAIQTTYWHDPLSLWLHAVAVAPESHTAHANLGTIYDAMGPDWLPLATAEFERAVQLDPDDFTAQDNLAGALLRLGRNDEAIAHMKRAIEIQDQIGIDRAAPDLQALIDERINLANVFLSRHRLKEASALYKSALRLDPNSQAAMNGLKAAGASKLSALVR